MNGMELSERFFRDWAEPVLTATCGELLERCAVGLIGPNSQVIGYDDEFSRDHAWGPFFVLWTPDDLPASEFDRLRHALQTSLPDEFLGFPLSARRDTPYNMADFVVTHLGEAQEFFLGTRGLPADETMWLSIPEHRLFEATAGKVFHDPADLIGSWRRELAYFPEDVWLKRLSFTWYVLSASCQIERSAVRNDAVGAAMFCAWFLEAAMRLALLLSRRYAPWRKWLFRYLGEHWPGDPALLDHLTRMAGDAAPGTKARCATAVLDILGTFANESGVIPPQRLRSDDPDNLHEFGFRGFAEAYRARIEGALADLPLSSGPVDLWGALHAFAVSPPGFMHNRDFVTAIYVSK